MSEFWDLLVHTDEYLLHLVNQNVNLTYLILFLIIFAESGSPLFFFLPGDGLLIAVGIIASSGALNIWLIILILILAGIIGYLLNYYTGLFFGKRFLAHNTWIQEKFIVKTKEFYKRHGSQTLIIGRFFPAVRAFTPFLAGMARINYLSFVKDTISGAVIWVCLFVGLGFFFGEIPFIQQNFFLLYIILVIITIIPLIWAGLRFLFKKTKTKN